MNLIELSNSESQIVWITSKVDYENTFNLGKSMILYDGRLCAKVRYVICPQKQNSRMNC